VSRVTTLGRWVDVLGACQTVQAAIQAQFEAAGVELPDRQYIAAGAPGDEAWDCEQLVVALQGIAWGVAEEAYAQAVQSGTNMSAQSMRHAVIEVSLVRAITVTSQRNGQPEVEDMNADGVRFLLDCGVLSQGMVVAASNLHDVGMDTISPVFPGGVVARPGIVDPVGPSGGFVGATATIYVSVMDLNKVS